MIDLLPDAEQQALIAAVVDFLEHEMPVDRLRPAAGGASIPVQPDRWADFAALGWFGVGLPEALGGIGLGVAEEVWIFRELGRHLVTPGVFAAAMAARLAAAEQPKLAVAIAGGMQRVALATDTDGTCRLLDAGAADMLLKIDADSLCLFRSDAFTDRRSVAALDGSVTLERAALVGVPPLRSDDPVLLRTARLLLLAQMIGAAEAALALTIDYAKLREQFGRPIASFQAIKHLCADLAVRAEAAWSATAFAALVTRADLAGAEFEAATAEIVATSAAVEITEHCIQLHGGIGFTAECHAHHFLKRVRLLAILLGDPRQARLRLLQRPPPS